MESNPYATPSAELLGSRHQTMVEVISDGTMKQLKVTRPWVRFLGVILLIGAGLILAGGLLLGVLLFINSTQGSPDQTKAHVFGYSLGVMGVFSVASLCYLYPGIKLNRYATRIDSFLDKPTYSHLEAALNEQRVLWRFIAIISWIGFFWLLLLPLMVKVGPPP
ncbi:MAG: hypothetical protein U0984_14480 [Prosthecobacter sp.]|nr:hypothetical protein [Prosthecobacter sp.]